MSDDTKQTAWPHLRPAANADAAQIREMVFDVLIEYGLQPDPECIDADLNDIEQSYIHPGGTFLVLEMPDGRIIGACGLYPVDEHTCELRKMYLRRNWRGKGHGRRMMEHALTEARQRRFTRMTLETASVLTEAIELYRRFGFERYEPAHLCRRCDQAYQRRL
ncbi:MAG: GNAT family N-acetyltransferase [Phycisphaerae bacterium]|nr:GNAT family N-acetyltransferase [Phycisphaerae bacterium]